MIRKLAGKPDGEIARKGDYEVRGCSITEVKKLTEFHYSKSVGKVAVKGGVHCLVRRSTGDVVGAAVWNVPTPVTQKAATKWRAWRLVEPFVTRGVEVPMASAVAAEAIREDYANVINLSRLIVAPGEPQNATSILLANSMKLVPSKYHTLVTYADTAQGHSGTIYKATNWIYAGQNKGDTVWVDRLGRQVSKRAGPWGKGRRTRTVAEMEAVGFRRKGKSSKIRFIFPRNP